MNDNPKKKSKESSMMSIAHRVAATDTMISEEDRKAADKAYLDHLLKQGGQAAVDQELQRRKDYDEGVKSNAYQRAFGSGPKAKP